MDLFYQVKYLTKKVMLTVMGPAELDDHLDPVVRLNREKKERAGGNEKDKPVKEYPKKRKFDSDSSTSRSKKSTNKSTPAPTAKEPPAKKATAKKPGAAKPAAKPAAKKTTTKPRNQPG
ncbi:MAG: translation initiation factor IF-2 [Actinomycetes bacterium]|jgi:translation initiation factor IF-2